MSQSKFNAKEKIELMNEFKNAVLKYLEEQRDINEAVLQSFLPSPIQDNDSEIRIMREREAIKLIDRISELKKHISVIKMMFPFKETDIIQRNAKRNKSI